MNLPQARQNELVIQEISEELVIYDLKRNKVHTLNPTAAWVWQHCDGKTSHAELASQLKIHLNTPHADDLLWLSLDRLEKAHLLEDEISPVAGTKITRRQALQKIGVSVAMLPVVASIVAPTAAQAASMDCAGVVPYSLDQAWHCYYAKDSWCDTVCQNVGAGHGGGTVMSCSNGVLTCCCN